MSADRMAASPREKFDQDPNHHISGFYTVLLMASLQDQLSASDIEEVLHRSGETRSVEELSQFSSWSSYDQFRRLLQEASVSRGSAIDGSDHGKPGGAVQRLFSTEMVGANHAFGSPGAVLASGDGTNPLVPIRRYETTEIEKTEWTIRERFVEGFAPYPEFCSFAAGQYALIPTLFGLAPAQVTEEECQARGDGACLFRIRWEDLDEQTARRNYLELHARVLEARLEQLQNMITDLASNERYEEVLQGIVDSALRCAGAGGALLALEPRLGNSTRVYSAGIDTEEAAAMADDVLLPGGVRKGIMAVKVTSARRHYGVLAIDEGGGVFGSQSQDTLETYGRLAAAALDAADAIEEARHQATTAQTLLELSSALAEIVSTEEMAARVVRAVPDVIDCDRVAFFLDNGDWRGNDGGEFKLAAAHGYPEDIEAAIRLRRYNGARPDTAWYYGVEHGIVSDFGTVATVSAPITVSGNRIGCIVAGVMTNPERLAITPHLANRLKGLAAQASIAIGNARLVDQIRFQSLHDPLTLLPNRALILDRTEQMLARARRTQVPVAALFIDLDGFKEVNDTLGHGFGDQLLRMVTARLSMTMRHSDSIGRLGGDEFIVLVDGTTMDTDPELVAERLLTVLRQPFELDHSHSGSVTLTASIGIAIGPRGSATELLRDADIALYEAKSAGKNHYVVFEPQMHTTANDRRVFEMDLRHALSRQQYFLVYQPTFNLENGRLTGVEALLRWHHPRRGIIHPDEFIPALEDSGLILEVGRWVLEEACRQGARWRSLGHRLEISVNMSVRQLEADRMVEDISRALESSGLDAQLLTIELSEASIIKNIGSVVPRLTALRDIGVRVGIDDFGTALASWTYLQRLPIDTLKIDRSFISAATASPASATMVRSLIQLGRSLGLETAAAGIEDAAQYSLLKEELCDNGQGYFLARPLTVAATDEFLGAQPATK
jgi:diguanylate cyclase (GGDEF)-like protein